MGGYKIQVLLAVGLGRVAFGAAGYDKFSAVHAVGKRNYGTAQPLVPFRMAITKVEGAGVAVEYRPSCFRTLRLDSRCHD